MMASSSVSRKRSLPQSDGEDQNEDEYLIKRDNITVEEVVSSTDNVIKRRRLISEEEPVNELNGHSVANITTPHSNGVIIPLDLIGTPVRGEGWQVGLISDVGVGEDRRNQEGELNTVSNGGREVGGRDGVKEREGEGDRGGRGEGEGEKKRDEGRGYSKVDLDVIDVCCENNWSSSLTDLIKVLEIGTCKCYYLPESRLTLILDKIDIVGKSKCFISSELYQIYKLLLSDLQYRPVGSPHYSLIKSLLEGTIDNMETIMTILEGTPQFSSAALISLHLKLHYVVEILIRNLSSKATGVRLEIECLLKQSLLRSMVKIIRTINHLITTNNNLSLIVEEVYEDLWRLLCLMVFVSTVKRNEIICLLAEELGTIQSIDERMALLQYIPSNFLLEYTIDLHLEKHFPFHTSAERLYNTTLYQCHESCLSKFCCVHLCRMPCRETGTSNDDQLCYLLFLLCTLLRCILLRETGAPLVSHPSLINLSDSSQLERKELNLMEFQGALASVKSHVPHFIDRLSEDATVLESLIEPRCWVYLHLLGNMTDLIVHSSMS